MLTVVGCLELDGWDVAAVFVQAAVVVPVDPFQYGDVDLFCRAPGPRGLNSSVMNNPIVVSARALV